MKTTIALTFALLLGGCASSDHLEGQIRAGEYVSPDLLFHMDIPVMQNPFVKKATTVLDLRRPDGGAEVEFAVLDLGEAWRFGAQPLPAGESLDTPSLGERCDRELARWTDAFGSAEVLLEERVQQADGPGLARVYYVPAASLLFVRQGEGPSSREAALIGVLVSTAERQQHVLYAVGQFDMPNHGGYYTLETERGRSKLAEQQLRRLQELALSLRLL